MRGKKLSIFSLILIISLTVSACKQSGNTTEKLPETVTETEKIESGKLPISKETISFTVGVPQSAVVENWDKNLQTLKMKEDLNVDLKFIELPQSNSELIQKIELMIVAGGNDLPDIIMSGLGGMANLEKYGQMGMIIPTNDYYKNLSYYIDESCKTTSMKKDEMLKYVTASDGKIYGLFAVSESLNNCYSNSRIMIYEPWLKSLGLKMPQTTEELTNVLRAFKTKDPNGNGRPDEIPLVGNKDNIMSNILRPLMNPFVYTQSNYYINDNGKIKFAAVEDGWRKGIAYIKSLFDEGLITPLSITQDSAQMNAIVNQKETIAGAFGGVSTSIMSSSDPRREEYIILDPLSGSTGLRQSTYEPSLPSIAMVITKNCKNPEAAFRLGDYMCSPLMSIWTRFGREGIDWKVLDKPVAGIYESIGYKGEIELINRSWGTLQNVWWANLGPRIMDGTMTLRTTAVQAPGVYDALASVGRSLGSSIKYANPNPVAGLIFNAEEQEVVNESMSIINDYVKESFVQFVTGKRNVDKEWDNYVAELKKLGLEKYLKAVQSAFDRMNR